MAREPSARKLYRTGRSYEKRKDFANAYLYYSKAAAADPRKKTYWQRAQALQRRAINASEINTAGTVALPGLQDTSATTLPSADADDVRESRTPQPPFELQAAPGERTFEFLAGPKMIWEQVTKAYGLDVIFDGDYPAGAAQGFRISDADYRTALYALMTATSSFFVPVSERLLLVVKDTEAKRREVENTVAVSIPIPEPFSLQEAQEMGRSVQQVMEIQRFSIDSAHRVVILRDRISKVRPAQLLFEEMLHGRAQVAIDVQLLAWNRSRTRSLGLGVPTSWPITSLVRTIALAGGPTSFALGIGSANVLATASRSDSTTLFQAEIRSADSQPAELKVGQRYPIQSVAYIGNVPSGEQSFTPPPSFTFEDLGFNLKITPRVHDAHEVTLDLTTEFKLLSGASLNGIPVVSNRKFATLARLRFDEAAVISGLVTKNDVRVLSGPAGLLNVPVLGTLLGTGTWTNDDAELLLVIQPRLISKPASELLTHQIWLGSETRPRLPM